MSGMDVFVRLFTDTKQHVENGCLKIKNRLNK